MPYILDLFKHRGQIAGAHPQQNTSEILRIVEQHHRLDHIVHGARVKKGEDFVGRIEGFHGASTTEPVVASNHFVVRRKMDVTVKPHGRIQFDEIMLYEVKDGQIVLEQFFY